VSERQTGKSCCWVGWLSAAAEDECIVTSGDRDSRVVVAAGSGDRGVFPAPPPPPAPAPGAVAAAGNMAAADDSCGGGDATVAVPDDDDDDVAGG